MSYIRVDVFIKKEVKKMNELQRQDISYTVPSLVFNNYQDILDQATELSQWLETIDITEDNISEGKKLLTKINKSVKAMNDERIRIKKELLAPYEIFAGQIKEIESIVKTADERLRMQVRELEEQQREEKKKAIKELWDLRVKNYKAVEFFEFEDFITEQHLNKTVTLKKVEQEMIEFLEKIEREVDTLNNMTDSTDLIIEYKTCKDMAIAIQNVEKRKEAKESVKAGQEAINKEEGVENDVLFLEIRTNKLNQKKVMKFLEDNDIEFKVN